MGAPGHTSGKKGETVLLEKEKGEPAAREGEKENQGGLQQTNLLDWSEHF